MIFSWIFKVPLCGQIKKIFYLFAALEKTVLVLILCNVGMQEARNMEG